MLILKIPVNLDREMKRIKLKPRVYSKKSSITNNQDLVASAIKDILTITYPNLTRKPTLRRLRPKLGIQLK